ncbi:hypothetical protein PFISCL1PPCAC_27005, partial [Pristionchus fissidentatus]
AIAASSLVLMEITNKTVEVIVNIRNKIGGGEQKNNDFVMFIPPKNVFAEVLYGEDPTDEELESNDKDNNED